MRFSLFLSALFYRSYPNMADNPIACFCDRCCTDGVTPLLLTPRVHAYHQHRRIRKLQRDARMQTGGN